jgi:hypothetical protein
MLMDDFFRVGLANATLLKPVEDGEFKWELGREVGSSADGDGVFSTAIAYNQLALYS